MMAAMGISKSSYDEKENLKNDNLTAETIFKLSSVLEVGEDYFFMDLTPEEYDEYDKNKIEVFLFSKLDETRRGFVREVMTGLEFGQKSVNKEDYYPEFLKRLIRNKKAATS